MAPRLIKRVYKRFLQLEYKSQMREAESRKTKTKREDRTCEIKCNHSGAKLIIHWLLRGPPWPIVALVAVPVLSLPLFPFCAERFILRWLAGYYQIWPGRHFLYHLSVYCRLRVPHLSRIQS